MPEMPKDFWPDHVLVEGRYSHAGREYRMCFAVTHEEMSCGRFVPEMLGANMDGLRLSLWREAHDSESEKVKA